MTAQCKIRLLLNQDAEPDHVKVWLTSAPVGGLQLQEQDWSKPSTALMRAAHEGVVDHVRPLLFSHSYDPHKLMGILTYRDLLEKLPGWVAGWEVDSLGVYLSPLLQESPEKWLSSMIEMCAGSISEIYLLCGEHDSTEMLNWVRRAASSYDSVSIEH